MGIDSAGAVQVVPDGVVPDQTGTYEQGSDADIEEHLAALRDDATAWNTEDHGGHWSLGGAQGKFALAQQRDGTWPLPPAAPPARTSSLVPRHGRRLPHKDLRRLRRSHRRSLAAGGDLIAPGIKERYMRGINKYLELADPPPSSPK